MMVDRKGDETNSSASMDEGDTSSFSNQLSSDQDGTSDDDSSNTEDRIDLKNMSTHVNVKPLD